MTALISAVELSNWLDRLLLRRKNMETQVRPMTDDEYKQDVHGLLIVPAGTLGMDMGGGCSEKDNVACA